MSLPKICTCPTVPAADCPFHYQQACGSLAAMPCCASSDSPTLAEMAEALRKAVLWGECASMHILYRENINWRYLDEARATLAAHSLHNKEL